MMQLPTFSGETGVFGLGRSGLACVAALLAAGNRVAAWDDKPEARAQAEALGAELRDLADDFGAAEQLVVSPGVPLTHPQPHPVVQAAAAHGCAVIGDLDLFAMALEAAGLRGKAVLVGITGTNGKSTTTALIGHMLQAAGKAVHVGGNIGTPVLDLPMPDPAAGETVYVLELSSYQLDLNRHLSCDIGVLLNLTPDHLDRHGDMTGYAAAKELLFADGKSARLAVFGIDTPDSERMAARLGVMGRTLRVAATHERADIFYKDGALQAGTSTVDMSGCAALAGAHNGQNAAAALAVGRALGLSDAAMADSFKSFAGMPHRLQPVARHAGLTFVNDSKATNAEATRHALAAYEPIYWIAGGIAKAGGLDGLAPHYGHCRGAFLIGEAAEGFAAELTPHMPAHVCGTMERAVAAAADSALAADDEAATVLLSPACASFDQFADFEARGRAFVDAVDSWCAAQKEGAA